MASSPAPSAPAALVLAAALLAAGCAGQPSRQSLQQVRAQQNPTDTAQRTITSFTPALRCMDDLMFRIGTRDVTLMMEELRDATTKVPVSARDMMTSAISDMTRRSRAVRLSVFGSDQQNLAQLLQQLQKTAAFEALPEYNVRGTISQLDEDVRRDASAFGFLTEKAFGVKFGNETRFSVLGFDTAVVRTDSMQLVHGVSSKNTTVIVRRDTSAGDGQARILGAGAVFSFSAARSEGPSQAARNMVELAAIELVGKLIRAPYWQCLGTPDQDPEVLRETEDWFVSMDPDERVRFVKERLRERRYYDGALDGEADEAYRAALRAWRVAAGLPAEGPDDLAQFRALLVRAVPPGPFAPLPRRAAARAAVAAPAAAATAAPTAVPDATAVVPTSAAAAPPTAGLPPAAAADPALATASTAAPGSPSGAPTGRSDATPGAVALPGGSEPAAPAGAAPIRLVLQPAGARQQLALSARTGGYVYCYAQDPRTQAIRRIFPNRFDRDPRLAAGETLRLPGRAGFSIAADQALACLHAPREVYADLPAPLRWGDFDPVALKSFDAIRQGFADASGQNVALVRPDGATR
ncbi:DUF4384 domain-containing protein [Piscinibacter sakaiensis]|uniref:DUF4384 domain-containing protein n=1 Tax=Piscinibacter sakaiensis TaxID=1547922 RepID=A0A0K8P1B8_PISS1|nr:DUF4384 domain-containing protein [Piscinibacter sakaiensis]GAP35965.1 hypothetical protein ISF6_1805 [Piscinibacter sakaiensis]